MKLKKLTAFVLTLALMVPFLVSCKKDPTPAEVWTQAVTKLASSENLSLSFDVTLGEYKVKVDYSGNRTSGEKSYDIMFDDNIYPIYTDGSKTYYSADELKFCVKSSEDSDIIREFMDFELTNAARMSLTDDKLIDPVLEVSENSKALSFSLSGVTFGAMFAPDEDIVFEEVKISAVLDLENNLKNISITSSAKGTEFYGIPLFDVKTEAKTLNIVVNNFDFTDSNAPKAPADKTDYPELVALAKMYPTGLFQSMKESSKISMRVDMSVDLVIASIKCTVINNTTTQQIDGITMTRSLSETTVDMLGTKNTQKEDVFTNGKDDYSYYTDAENGNHKIKNEDGSSVNQDDLLSIFTNADNLEEIFENTDAAGSTIIIEISGEVLQKLMNESSTGDFDPGIDVDVSSVSFRDATLIIKLKKGFIDTVSLETALETSGDLMGTGTTQTITIDIDMTMTYESLMENYVVEIPAGYENYEDWT